MYINTIQRNEMIKNRLNFKTFTLFGANSKSFYCIFSNQKQSDNLLVTIDKSKNRIIYFDNTQYTTAITKNQNELKKLLCLDSLVTERKIYKFI